MLQLFTGESSATFSPCRRYRYTLRRVWDQEKKVVLWIMLNPSTADAAVNDPTIRRCMGFAHAWGYGGIEVRNIFALRSTDPKALYTHPDPVGPENVVVPASPFLLHVAAWGNHGALNGRGDEVVRAFASAGYALCCLGMTKEKQPQHPLRLVSTLQPMVYHPTNERS